MPAQNLPADLIRILSFHGPVEVWVGTVTAKVHCAPFEDLVYLLIPRNSALERELLESVEVIVNARHAAGDYAVRMTGRCHAGLPLTRHPDRGALSPWAQEGAQPARFLASPFVPAHIDLVRVEAGERVHYHGDTPDGRDAPHPLRSWLTAAFLHIGIVFAAAGFIVPWLWLAAHGPEFPWRPMALVVSVLSSWGFLAGGRLATLAVAYARWREGRARAVDAPLLTEGRMAPARASRVGWLLIGLSAIGVASVGSVWGQTLALIAFLTSGVWLLVPAWLLHLSHSAAEDRQ